jgi:hypothetical protein
MKLPYHYYIDEVDKFVIDLGKETRPSLTLNATRLSCEKIDEIESWCRTKHNCKYYSCGVIVFNHSAALTEFLLRWS